ncbi:MULTISPECIES: hypothetical protein [Kitasatospora]|uniref:hypothetical protein n=1 Tax=Kitasatospora TaxID=2063 RepID=UPI000C26F63B|nr:hypothetical protein [Kitasatospora sp. CB02891]PJN21121.1 hypothetical protein CG736_34830 [Kitasatospora sp. CB02891]
MSENTSAMFGTPASPPLRPVRDEVWENCTFDGCTSPLAEQDHRRPSAFCERPEHNAITQWLAKYAGTVGGTAAVEELPNRAGYLWEAAGADGTVAAAEEPLGSWEDAAQDAVRFLNLHTRDDRHVGCFEPHRRADGEYVDCDGHPL